MRTIDRLKAEANASARAMGHVLLRWVSNDVDNPNAGAFTICRDCQRYVKVVVGPPLTAKAGFALLSRCSELRVVKDCAIAVKHKAATAHLTRHRKQKAHAHG